jgi:DNA polymerase-3 subunit delta
MSEIHHKELPRFLQQRKTTTGKDPTAVYLIYGEEMLVQQACELVLENLLPAHERSLNTEILEGGSEVFSEVIRRVTTYSLLPGNKVVAWRDTSLFSGRPDHGKLLEAAKKAHEENDIAKAAKVLVNFMAHADLAFEDLSPQNRGRIPEFESAGWKDEEWLDDIIAHCRQHELVVPGRRDDTGIMEQVIKKGLPRGNHLIMTTDWPDKRRSLYKLIAKDGVVVDCSVPKGERRADKMAQETVLAETMQTVLKKSRKTMDRQAFQALCDMTGFDLRTFAGNLDMLISFVGERDRITADDVMQVVRRSKSDPIYEFTNAVGDRNLETALFYMNSIISDQLHPLQILAALVNQVRRLLVARDFLESAHGAGWHAGMSYPTFQSRIMPQIAAYDRELLDVLEVWERQLATRADSGPGGAAGKRQKKRKIQTDLILAKSPQTAYPVFQILMKAGRYERQELIDAIALLNEADTRLKSTGQEPKLILEQVVWKICRGRPVEAERSVP